MKILTLGDVHGNVFLLNKLIDSKRPDIILQCGDFGYFPNFVKEYNLPKINTQGALLYWCDGNHEDHNELQKLVKKFGHGSIPLPENPNLIYMPRGSTLDLPDGRTILFMGGADSIDKNQLTMFVDWFPQEVISYKDIENLPDKKIDIIISHTAPISFNILPKYMDFYYSGKMKDPSRDALEYIFNKYHPKLWYCGHWHLPKTEVINDCHFTALDYLGKTLSWEWLK